MIDDREFPGARCRYHPADASGQRAIRAIRVAPPVVYARDLSADRDRGLVGWHWFVAERGDRETGWARDDRPAALSSVRISVPVHLRFRVRVRMYWFARGDEESASAPPRIASSGTASRTKPHPREGDVTPVTPS